MQGEKIVWEVLNWAWDRREWILARMQELREWWRSPKGGNILIIGSGGGW
jgi:hypothetical protein